MIDRGTTEHPLPSLPGAGEPVRPPGDPAGYPEIRGTLEPERPGGPVDPGVADTCLLRAGTARTTLGFLVLVAWLTGVRGAPFADAVGDSIWLVVLTCPLLIWLGHSSYRLLLWGSGRGCRDEVPLPLRGRWLRCLLAGVLALVALALPLRIVEAARLIRD